VKKVSFWGPGGKFAPDRPKVTPDPQNSPQSGSRGQSGDPSSNQRLFKFQKYRKRLTIVGHVRNFSGLNVGNSPESPKLTIGAKNVIFELFGVPGANSAKFGQNSPQTPKTRPRMIFEPKLDPQSSPRTSKVGVQVWGTSTRPRKLWTQTPD
jgi:hypothetical protein